jgi:protein SCO1/2
MILSHSIDPEYDQPAVLRKYAGEKGADTRIWKFLTGDRDSIYSICENHYLAFAQKDDKAPGGYIHSGFLVLIDKNRHIRGAYDGTEEGKTDELIRDIRILLQE